MHQNHILFHLFPSCFKFTYVILHLLYANRWRMVRTLDENCFPYETLCLFCANVNFSMIDSDTYINFVSANPEKVGYLLSESRIVHLSIPLL